MAEFLWDEFALIVSSTTVFRVLQQARWSRKVVQRRAAERSEPLRRQWMARQLDFDADQLVFLDESAAHERTGDRKYGWSPSGLVCSVSGPARRSERWSILPALGVDGYITYLLHQGSITAAIFESFLEYQLLPCCTAWPGPRSIIVVDNASIHRSQRIRDLCEERGVTLLFLPPYSPDFNPIEATFHDIKAWIRSNYLLLADFESFSDFLDFAVSQNSGRFAREHFKKAGYIV